MTPRFRRLAGKSSAEWRFRVECELRKAAGRLRASVVSPQWDRRRLAARLSAPSRPSGAWRDIFSALERGEYLAAHRALARHFATRTSPFPLESSRVSSVAQAVAQLFPGARNGAVNRATAICNGHYDLLGFRGINVGRVPNWHRDPVHGREAPRTFWAAVRYLDPAVGDHKIIWELNRHQHWLALGRAFALSGDARFYEVFTTQLRSWLHANPPLTGINWASMLELSFRALSWLWALEFFAAAATDQDRDPWLVDILLALDRQLTHVEQNLSYYFSPNTHLTGEALALYVAGVALPELTASARRQRVGRDVLVHEALRQIRSDGGHVELSPHYQRYSTDFYLLATLLARRAGDEAAGTFEAAAVRQARYLRTMTDVNGIRPLIGDDDGGQLFPVCGRDAADCRDTLATAACLLDEPALAIEAAPEETVWLCGPEAATVPIGGRSDWPSQALLASGYFVSRFPGGDQLVFDAGPHGYLNGGHAHSDALSCVLSAAGRPVLIDPGTATYTMDSRVRDQFRSTAMHNTLLLDGLPQSVPRGPFHWSTMAAGRTTLWRISPDCDYVEGSHDGYAPRQHTRAVLAIRGVGWWIFDHVIGSGAAAIECYWHIHPSWQLAGEANHVVGLYGDGARLALASTAPLAVLPAGTHPLAVWSPAYGTIEPAPVAIARVSTALPTTMACFIPARSGFCDMLRIESVRLEQPPHGWLGSAFRARWRGGAMSVLVALEGDGVTRQESDGPSQRWGTADLRTDARLAAVIDHAATRSEVILVNGSSIDTPRSNRLASLPHRAALVRTASSQLAPGVHEVGAGYLE